MSEDLRRMQEEAARRRAEARQQAREIEAQRKATEAQKAAFETQKNKQITMQKLTPESPQEPKITVIGGGASFLDRQEQAKASVELAQRHVAQQIATAKQSLEASKRNIAQAEEFKYGWGKKIEWGDRTYDLGTTAGWKDYQAALREAKRDVNQAENKVRLYESKTWKIRTEREAKTVIKKAAKVVEEAEKITAKQGRQQEKLKRAMRDLETGTVRGGPYVVSAVSEIADDMKDTGFKADRPSTYLSYEEGAVRKPYNRMLQGMSAIAEMLHEEGGRGAKPRPPPKPNDIKDAIDESLPGTYTYSGSNVIAYMGSAIASASQGILEEVSFPFGVGVAPAKRGSELGFRVVGGLLMPSPADYALTQLIRKLSLRKNGAKLIDELFIKQVPLEKRLGAKISIFELLDAEKLAGVTGVKTHTLRTMLKTVDLRGLTKLKGKIGDNIYDDLINWERMQGSQKLTTAELRKLGKALDDAAEQLTGTQYWREKRQYEKLGKQVFDTIASGEPDDLARELAEFEKLIGTSKLSINDIRKGMKALGKTSDEVIQNAAKLDDAMSSLTGTENWIGKASYPTAKEQAEAVAEVTGNLRDLRKALDSLIDIDPDSGKWTRFGLLSPGEKAKLIEKYRKMLKIWEEHPEIFTTGAAYRPSSIKDLESYLKSCGWEPDDYVNFLIENAEIMPAGLFIHMMGSFGESTTKQATKAELSQAELTVPVDLDLPFEEGLGEVPTVGELSTLEEEAAKEAEEEKEAAKEVEKEEEAVVQEVAQAEEEEAVVQEVAQAEEEEAEDGGGEEYGADDEGRGGRVFKPSTPHGKLGALRFYMGSRRGFRVVFKYPSGSKEALNVEARTYVEAMSLAQRARAPRKEMPVEVNIWPA